MDIRSLVKKEIASLKAYQAKEVSCRVKLDANESPYGFEEALMAVRQIRTNRYPDPEAKKLKAILAKGLGLSPEKLLQGNGSDELIYNLITTFGGPVLYPVPTFSMYGIIAQALGEEKREIPLDREFDIDLGKMETAVIKNKPKLVFLSSPNNPTGNCFSSERILRLVEISKGLVVVDEAYQPFSDGKGFVPLLKDYKNLVILRTLSKVGLAALRFGYLIAHEDIIREVNKVRLPFNVNALSQAVAVEALKKKTMLKEAILAITEERNRLLPAMERIRGVEPFPSEANFILFRVKDPKKVHAMLLNAGILVRDISDAVAGCLRVTVSTPKDNDLFLRGLGRIAKEL
jgi:histidinol-phosphate aminotransferase